MWELNSKLNTLRLPYTTRCYNAAHNLTSTLVHGVSAFAFGYKPSIECTHLLPQLRRPLQQAASLLPTQMPQPPQLLCLKLGLHWCMCVHK